MIDGMWSVCFGKHVLANGTRLITRAITGTSASHIETTKKYFKGLKCFIYIREVK